MANPQAEKAYSLREMQSFAACQTLIRSAVSCERALHAASLEAASVRASVLNVSRLSPSAFADVRRLRETADAIARDLAEIEAEASDKLDAPAAPEPVRSAA